MNATQPEYRFEGFTLQVSQRRLLDGEGTAIELSPRLFDTLLYLVERAGQLLEKDRLLAELWPGLVVEENSLSQSISALRKALGDDAQRSRFIQTVPRRGFRFVAPVVLVDAAAAVTRTEPQALEIARSIAPPADTAPAPPPSHRPVDPPTQAAATPLDPGRPDAPPTSHRVTRRASIATAAAVVAAAAGASAWRWQRNRSPFHDPGAITLAVLPFKPIVSGVRDEWLEIGMAESLIARLSNLPGVAVRSVGSVRRFGGAEQDPISAARALNVVWILDGSLQRAGDRVRITARLLNTDSGEAAWSGSFDEAFTGMFDLQDSISTRVAQVLAPLLGQQARQRLTGAGGTRNVDAYQLYLTARQQAQGIKTAGLVKSIELYRQAIALDSAYALAYSGMGESYRRMIFGADGEPAVVLAAAMRCNQQATQLDPGLAEAHAGLGWTLFWQQWNWAGAAATFDRALALNASEANAHLGYSQLLATLQREAEALQHLRLARESDPLSLILLTLESGSLLGAGRVQEAHQRLQRVFDIEPDFWVAHMVQAAFMLADGKAEEAIQSLERADQLADGSSQPAAALGFVLARQGQPERAKAVLKRLLRLGESRYVPPTSIGMVHAGLRDKEATLAALERGLAVRDVRMTLVRQDGRWRLVKDEPRFQAVMRRMQLV